MTLPETVANAFQVQAAACRNLGSPFNARVCDLIGERLDDQGPFGHRIHAWSGDPVPDALALRTVGALNALARSGRCPPLAAAYPPADVDDTTLWRAIETAIADHGDFLATWLDSPPQTNEVARSGVLLGGFLTIARLTGLPLEIYEIGSSAGLNLGFDDYRFDLGVGGWGPPDAAARISTRWEGVVPALSTPMAVAHREGCDVNPLDAGSAADRERLLAYVWPDQTDRVARIAAALGIAANAGRKIEKADAADWVEARFARDGAVGRARVLFHTIVWQYLPRSIQERIEVAMYAAGARASAERPVAWLRLEADGVPGSAGIQMTLWPKGETVDLGRGDYHGRWARWTAATGRPQHRLRSAELGAAVDVDHRAG